MFEILNHTELAWLAAIHDAFSCAFMDAVMGFITATGNIGIIWIACAVLTLCFRKTRRTGITLAVALIFRFSEQSHPEKSLCPSPPLSGRSLDRACHRPSRRVFLSVRAHPVVVCSHDRDMARTRQKIRHSRPCVVLPDRFFKAVFPRALRHRYPRRHGDRHRCRRACLPCREYNTKEIHKENKHQRRIEKWHFFR